MCIKCAVRLISSRPSSGMSTCCQSAILNWAKPDNKRVSRFILKLIFSAHLAMPSHRAFPPWRYLQIFWTWGSCSVVVSRSICPGSPPWLPGHHQLWKMLIRYWLSRIQTPYSQKRANLNDRNLLALQRGVHWQCRQQNLWSAEKKEVTEAIGNVTILTTITFALVQTMANAPWEKKPGTQIWCRWAPSLCSSSAEQGSPSSGSQGCPLGPPTTRPGHRYKLHNNRFPANRAEFKYKATKLMIVGPFVHQTFRLYDILEKRCHKQVV